MQELNYKIVTFTDTCFFIYKETTVIQPPTVVDSTSTLTTTYNPTTDIPIERRTIEELMVEFDLLGLVMPTDPTIPVEPIWHDKTRGVQLFLTYENNTILMQGNYGILLLDYFKNIIPPAPTFNEPEGVYIFLCFNIYSNAMSLIDVSDFCLNSSVANAIFAPYRSNIVLCSKYNSHK